MTEPKRKPTHRLRAYDKASGASATIGAAWLNADGHLSIKLELGVNLAWNDGLTITLWPVDAGKDAK